MRRSSSAGSSPFPLIHFIIPFYFPGPAGGPDLRSVVRTTKIFLNYFHGVPVVEGVKRQCSDSSSATRQQVDTWEHVVKGGGGVLPGEQRGGAKGQPRCHMTEEAEKNEDRSAPTPISDAEAAQHNTTFTNASRAKMVAQGLVRKASRATARRLRRASSPPGAPMQHSASEHVPLHIGDLLYMRVSEGATHGILHGHTCLRRCAVQQLDPHHDPLNMKECLFRLCPQMNYKAQEEVSHGRC